MLVSEIFRTLQGEGRYAGYPCLFLRTSGCNLRCAWCDTPYTSWTVEGESLDVEEILELTKPWAEVEHAVISGGEPLLQKDLAKVIAGLKTQGHFITVETAGTLFESEVRPDFFSISPKLANSRPNSERHATELALHDRNNDHRHLEHYKRPLKSQ